MQHAPVVDMPERPVVEAGRRQLRELAGRIVVMPFQPVDVAVQHGEVKGSAFLHPVAHREIVLDRGLPIGYAVHVRRQLPLARKSRQAADLLRPEHVNRRGPIEPGGPAAGRIVVAVHDECLNARLRQPAHRLLHAKLGAERPVGRVVQIARQYQEVQFFPQHRIDELVERVQRRIFKPLADRRRNFGQSAKRNCPSEGRRHA